MMRILPFLFLLPVLVASASCTQVVPSAIANDDRPASPQPAIAPSAVPAKLTIESLAGTYKGVVNEQSLTALLKEAKKRGSDEASLKATEAFIRQSVDQMRITIKADGTFEALSTLKRESGNVKIKGNQLILTTSKIDGKPLRFAVAPITLEVSTDRKIFLYDKSKRPSKIVSGYVKQ